VENLPTKNPVTLAIPVHQYLRRIGRKVALGLLEIQRLNNSKATDGSTVVVAPKLMPFSQHNGPFY
jgi:hypothetical protein